MRSVCGLGSSSTTGWLPLCTGLRTQAPEGCPQLRLTPAGDSDTGEQPGVAGRQALQAAVLHGGLAAARVLGAPSGRRVRSSEEGSAFLAHSSPMDYVTGWGRSREVTWASVGGCQVASGARWAGEAGGGTRDHSSFTVSARAPSYLPCHSGKARWLPSDDKAA